MAQSLGKQAESKFKTLPGEPFHWSIPLSIHLLRKFWKYAMLCALWAINYGKELLIFAFCLPDFPAFKFGTSSHSNEDRRFYTLPHTRALRGLESPANYNHQTPATITGKFKVLGRNSSGQCIHANSLSSWAFHEFLGRPHYKIAVSTAHILPWLHQATSSEVRSGGWLKPLPQLRLQGAWPVNLQHLAPSSNKDAGWLLDKREQSLRDVRKMSLEECLLREDR